MLTGADPFGATPAPAVGPGLGPGPRASRLDDRPVGGRRAVRLERRAAARPAPAAAPARSRRGRWPSAPDLSSVGHDRPSSTLYDRAGGTPFFEALVGRFYAGVAEDPLLRPIYPEQPTSARRERRLQAVPDPVLGRPDHLRPGARPPAPADAPRAVRDRAGRARPLARPHARAVAEVAPPPDVAAELERYFAMAARGDAQPRLSAGAPALGRSSPTCGLMQDQACSAFDLIVTEGVPWDAMSGSIRAAVLSVGQRPPQGASPTPRRSCPSTSHAKGGHARRA